MLQVLEFLDIAEIERIRRAATGKGLDSRDSLSWHAALKDGENTLGTGRFYRRGGGLHIDSVCVTDGKPSSLELLFRSVLLKACSLEPEFISTDGGNREFTDKFGFTDTPHGYSLSPADVRFPSCCGGADGGDCSQLP